MADWLGRPPEAEGCVAGHLITISHGRAARAAAEISAESARTGLCGATREAVDACTGYLTGRLDQLDYDTALAVGWPVAAARSRVPAATSCG
ncbi:hypothetical protein [Streptomyces melanogenes]|uniref:hypothetical protein n=1 Tax=Streptomyces melanogenes TaxID=67326 RepID=UPI0037AE5F31